MDNKSGKPAQHRLFAFDFDCTIINDNSDVVFCNLLKPDQIPSEVAQLSKQSSDWTEFMSAIFVLLHELSFTKNEFLKTISQLKETSGMCNLIESLAANPLHDIIIVSDSNSLFIDHWLETNKLAKHITKIFTNPAGFDENDLLLLKPYHSGKCSRCSKNLDKGSVLVDFMEMQRDSGINYESVCYIGDGRNDLCPVLKLTDRDFACARKGYALHKLLESDNSEFNHKYAVWQDGDDLKTKIKEKFNIDL